MRAKAYEDGWNNGSACLASYAAINPWPEPDNRLIPRVERRYGKKSDWCYFGADLIRIGPCEARHPRVRVQVDGNQLRIFLLKANTVDVYGVHPPDFRRAKPGILLFDGTSDQKKITGTFWYHTAGCSPVAYQGEGNFVENNGLFFSAALPEMKRCEVQGYIPALHFFKNLGDIL
jgi:hypothetical protein